MRGVASGIVSGDCGACGWRARGKGVSLGGMRLLRVELL